MTQQDWHQLKVEIEAWIWLALIGLAFAAAWWIKFRGQRPTLLPLQRQRALSWGGVEVGLAFYLALALPFAAHDFLAHAGFYSWYYGDAFNVAAAVGDANPAKKLDAARRFLWESTVAFPFQVLLLLTLLHVGSGARMYQLGLTSHRWLTNCVVGYCGWLVVSPIVLALNLAAELVFVRLPGSVPEAHPLFLLIQERPFPMEWVLILITALVAAPFFEELLFRGVLQPWLMRRRWGADAAIAASFAWALFARVDRIQSALQIAGAQDRLTALLAASAPAIFVLVLIPGYVFVETLCWRWLPTPDVARTIYATSCLFAAFHSSVWPTPIALFPLALGLGFLAYRTQSLIGPITFHVLFNGVSCFALILDEIRS